MLNTFNVNLDEIGTMVGVYCPDGIVGNVQIAFPDTNFMGTALLLSFFLQLVMSKIISCFVLVVLNNYQQFIEDAHPCD